MTTNNILNKVLFVILLSLTILISSWKTENNNAKMFRISGDASGNQEVPPVAEPGTATLNGTYNADNNTLTYTINWNGLTNSVTSAHFHGPAPIGSNADPIHDINISNNGTNGTASGSIILTDSTETYLLSGKIYYNLHTLMHLSGEIRGQVVATNN